MTAPGVFEITAAPGKYELRLPQRNDQPSQSSEVEISQDNQELDASAGQAVSTITAKVELIGEDRASAANGIRASQRAAPRRRLGAVEPSPRSHIRRPLFRETTKSSPGPRRAHIQLSPWW